MRLQNSVAIWRAGWQIFFATFTGLLAGLSVAMTIRRVFYFDDSQNPAYQFPSPPDWLGFGLMVSLEGVAYSLMLTVVVVLPLTVLLLFWRLADTRVLDTPNMLAYFGGSLTTVLGMNVVWNEAARFDTPTMLAAFGSVLGGLFFTKAFLKVIRSDQFGEAAGKGI